MNAHETLLKIASGHILRTADEPRRLSPARMRTIWAVNNLLPWAIRGGVSWSGGTILGSDFVDPWEDQ